MNLRPIFILFSLVIISISCSVYKSTGRKSFESKSSGNLTASSVGIAETEPSNNETCWSQPASDPLWNVDAQSSLIVKKLNEDEIQVCLEAP